MSIEYTEELAHLSGAVSVEEAENLLQWIQQYPHGKADLSGCNHIHAAALQVLMAAGIEILTWPQDEHFKTWLNAALAT